MSQYAFTHESTVPSAVRFFMEHAGSSYTPGKETAAQGKYRGARRLAMAERYARTHDWEFRWISDEAGCIGCDCGDPECACSNGTCSPEVCILDTPMERYAESLGSICGATREYGRVVEAELALEHMTRSKGKKVSK